MSNSANIVSAALVLTHTETLRIEPGGQKSGDESRLLLQGELADAALRVALRIVADWLASEDA